MTEQKTKEYPNFYENLKEANMRLRGTVVLYDGVPHYIMIITNHKDDGIFRVYMEPTGSDMILHQSGRPPYDAVSYDSPNAGLLMDEWLAKNPNSKVLRKHMNSPKFNKFRPFPLGMCNYKGSVYYVERQPTRKSEQGLIPSMMLETRLSLTESAISPGYGSRGGLGTTNDWVRAMILGDYPSAQECVDNLKDSQVTNEGAAFHRLFAFLRGPVNTLFLCHKDSVIGVLPSGKLDTLRLSQKYFHLKEAVEELKIFNTIEA